MLSATKQVLLSGTGTGVRRLTLTNAITDTTRYAGVEGDGLTAPAGYGVWPAATNLVTDGGCETDAAYYTADNGGAGVVSVTRITTDAAFGSACAQVVTDGNNTDQGQNMATFITGLSAGTAYSWAMSAKSVSGATAARLRIKWYDAASSVISTSDTDITLTTSWARYSISATSPALTTKCVAQIINKTATAMTVNIDGMQFEAGEIATPYIETDGGTAARSAGRVQVPAQGLFTPTQGAVVLRQNVPYASASLPNAAPMSFSWGDDTGTAYIIAFMQSGNLNVRRRGGGGSFDAVTVTATFSAGATQTVFAAWESAQIKASLDGSTFSTGAVANGIPTLPATCDLERDLNGSYYNYGRALWAITFKGTPTNADAALGWMTQNAVPTMNQIAQLSAASKPTLLIPAKTADAVMLPAYFGGTL